jgi:hypothetical protein
MTSSMGTFDKGAGTTPRASEYADYGGDRGTGWTTFAGVLLLIAGALNIIYGIAAIDQASFFVNDSKYVFSDLQTWGWIGLILGIMQVLAAFSVWRGGLYGRWFGILVLSLNAIAQLLMIPSYPFLSLALFSLDILALYGLAAYTTRPEAVRGS